jgi:uncharacterized membrane protein YidH (DUF202 family)
MKSFLNFIKNYYTLYAMLLVVGSGLFAYFVDYKNMERKNNKKEAKISKFIGLTYIIGGILLYILVIFI